MRDIQLCKTAVIHVTALTNHSRLLYTTKINKSTHAKRLLCSGQRTKNCQVYICCSNWSPRPIDVDHKHRMLLDRFSINGYIPLHHCLWVDSAFYSAFRLSNSCTEVRYWVYRR